MRELANETAQADIKTFEKRFSWERALVNAAYLLIVLPCFAILWRGRGHSDPTLTCLAAGVGCLVSVTAGTQAVRLFLRSCA